MLLAFLLVVFPAASWGEEVTVRADTLTVDQKSDSYTARGDVHMVRDGLSLIADSVIYTPLTSEALAQGGFFMEKGEDWVRGERLRINLKTEQGEISNAELFMKKTNFRIRGQRVEKTGEKDYVIRGGSFTTCDGDRPSWRFQAQEIKVTLEEYATGRDAVFYAGNVPVFYLPYLVFPVKRDRQSGFLIPKFGRSTKKGVYLSQPYYWAIDQSQDVTFALTLQSARGAGGAVDYRYLRPSGGEGGFQAFGIYDTRAEMFRGEVNQRHLEFFSPDTAFTSDLHAITDRSYYKDYGEAVGEYNRQYFESTISIDHKWERYNVTGLLSYVEDLRSPTNDESLQRLPAVRFLGAGEKVGPFFFSLESAATNFYRVSGVAGERLALHPRLALYRHPTRELDLSLYGGYEERFYNSYGAGGPSGMQGVGMADAGGILALPLEKVYNGAFRHVLAPSLGYSYVEQRQQGRLPFFDYNDRRIHTNMATWSVANTVTVKKELESGAAAYRDVLYVRLSQGYDFAGSRPASTTRNSPSEPPPRDLLTLVDRGHHLTDLMLEGWVSPVDWLSFGFDGRLNPIDGYLSTANLSARATGEKGNEAEFGYRFSRGEIDYIEGRFSYPIYKPFYASAFERYSLDKGGLLESRFAVEYRHQCWSLILSYADRPGNREFMASFTLAGVGVGGGVKLF